MQSGCCRTPGTFGRADATGSGISVIRIEAIQLRRLADESLRHLQVADAVRVTDLDELQDGMWLVRFEDQLPATRFPVFEVYLQHAWSADDAEQELRRELRQKLWICPLCDRRAEIRRLVDQEAFRVVCERCGRFEIDYELLEHLRAVVDDNDPIFTRRLVSLAERLRAGGDVPLLSLNNWIAIADLGTQRSG